MSFYDFVARAARLESDGADLIRLDIGATQLPTPRAAIERATQFVAQQKAEYVSALGTDSFREVIARREDVSPDQVVVGPGSKYLLYAIAKALLRTGDRVIIPTPAWPAYAMICDELGAEAVMVPAEIDNNWHPGSLPFDDAELLILCNPHNPTSIVYAESRVRDWIEVATERKIPILLDEAYRGLAFSPIETFPDTIRVRSFSKEFSMEGWRLAYAVVPVSLTARLSRFISATVTCVSPIMQEAGESVLADDELILTSFRAQWRQRADHAIAELRAAGFRFAEPGAAMYLFATHDGITDSVAYSERALDAGVAVSAGQYFAGYNRFVRMSLNRDADTLTEAVRRMTVVLG